MFLKLTCCLNVSIYFCYASINTFSELFTNYMLIVCLNINRFGDTSLQDKINQDSLSLLKEHFSRFQRTAKTQKGHGK